MSPFTFISTAMPFLWTSLAGQGARVNDDVDFYCRHWVRQVWSQRWGMSQGLGWPVSPVPLLGLTGSGAGFCSPWLSSGRTVGNFKVERELVVVAATKRSEWLQHNTNLEVQGYGAGYRVWPGKQYTVVRLAKRAVLVFPWLTAVWLT